MKTFFTGLLVCMSMLLLISCQREVDERIDPMPNQTSDSIFLEKYVELDTTLPPGADTLGKNLYSYDSKKRIQRTLEIFYGNAPLIDTTKIDYYYSGNDTLPYKSVIVWSIFPTVYHDTVFLTYMNGLVRRDSVIEYDVTNGQFFGTSVAYYSTTGNNTAILKREYFTRGPGALIDAEWNGVISKTYQQDCIVAQDDNITPFPVNRDRAHYVVSYDGYINPFYKTEIPYPILNKWIVQKNNVLSSKSWDIPLQLESDDIYSYVYNINGYPVLVRRIDGRGGRSVKGFFYYTN